ncbi:hypothetical protein LXL04_007868 [Taraxacum kok-saghyz]
MLSLPSVEGFTGRKSGPEQTQVEFTEARTDALTTTISSLWRSDRGEFSHTVVIMFVVARLARECDWMIIKALAPHPLLPLNSCSPCSPPPASNTFIQPFRRPPSSSTAAAEKFSRRQLLLRILLQTDSPPRAVTAGFLLLSLAFPWMPNEGSLAGWISLAVAFVFLPPPASLFWYDQGFMDAFSQCQEDQSLCWEICESYAGAVGGYRRSHTRQNPRRRSQLHLAGVNSSHREPPVISCVQARLYDCLASSFIIFCVFRRPPPPPATVAVVAVGGGEPHAV